MIAIDNFPGYYVDATGAVYSTLKRNGQHSGIVDGCPPKPLKPILMKSTGYFVVNLHRNGKQHTRHVHDLVLSAFVGPRPDGMVACHNNGNTADNRASNLRWDTRQSNEQDKVSHGTKLFGERHHRSKLTDDQVRAIRNAPGHQRDIARLFGISQSQVSNIKLGRQWTHGI